MAGNAKNIRLGPCRVIWGVEDLGFTKGGVEVSITSTQVSITSDQFGETPMDKYVTSRTVNVKVPLIETIPGKLDLILNGGDGTAELATVQTVAGLSMRNASQSLVLHPLSKADDDYSEDFVVIRAGVIPNIEATYDSDNERVWSVTFTSFPYYGEFGDIMEADRSGVVVYGGRSAVVANGGLYRASKRSTIGTYFDKNGVMQTANAYVTRPNYVYQNGVWKQKGWLYEPQATNYCVGIGYAGVPYTTESLSTPKDAALAMKRSISSPAATYCCSIFINTKNNKFQYLDYWLSGGGGNGSVFDMTTLSYKNGIFGNAGYEIFGDYVRLWIYSTISDPTNPNGNALWIPRGSDKTATLEFSCPQMEIVPDVNTLPSSYIPADTSNATTRAAD